MLILRMLVENSARECGDLLVASVAYWLDAVGHILKPFHVHLSMYCTELFRIQLWCCSLTATDEAPSAEILECSLRFPHLTCVCN
jgi:hypothetical protein